MQKYIDKQTFTQYACHLMMAEDGLFYLASDVHTLMASCQMQADDANRLGLRVQELEAFIKVLLPSWPDGEHYPTEMSVLSMQQQEIAELQKALRWVIDNRVIWHYGDFAKQQEYDALEAVQTPDDVYALVSSLMVTGVEK
jgi:hypothetical protein